LGVRLCDKRSPRLLRCLIGGNWFSSANLRPPCVCTEICEHHKCRSEDNHDVVAENQMLLSSVRRATLYFCFCRILTLYWLGFGVFKLAGAAASRFRVNTPDSNWLNLDNNGFGVSRRSVKNKMFCAHVVAHEPWLTAVSHKAVGHQSQRSIKNSCVCWHLCRQLNKFQVMSRRDVSFPRRQPSVRIAYCTLDTIPEARDIHNQINSGERFGRMAKMFPTI
jgi:hypothetical protein